MQWENRLTEDKKVEFLDKLKTRFMNNMNRHKTLEWNKIHERLNQRPEKIFALNKMEETGGEPDIIGIDQATGELLFCDCSEESPKGRRSLCYDRKALDSRKENKPENNVIDMALSLEIELLTVEQYEKLQEIGEFDCKTSSWLKTPDDIRELGGAIFGDRRYNHVFIYHNGADSYYSVRGFRGLVRI